MWCGGCRKGNESFQIAVDEHGIPVRPCTQCGKQVEPFTENPFVARAKDRATKEHQARRDAEKNEFKFDYGPKGIGMPGYVRALEMMK